jgi:hypothetical protein
LGGEALYNVGHGRFRVDPNSYLILNQSQPYEIIVDAENMFESFCLFFEDGFAEEVQYSLSLPAPKLLDNPQPIQSGLAAPVCFFEERYPHDDTLSPALFRSRAKSAASHRPSSHRDLSFRWIREPGFIQRPVSPKDGSFARKFSPRAKKVILKKRRGSRL